MGADDTPEEAEDQRTIELESLAAIFPELEIFPGEDPDSVRAKLVIQVQPLNGVGIRTPSTSDGGVVEIKGLQTPQATLMEVHKIEFLPSLTIEIGLTPQYPTKEPPYISLSSQEAWLSQDKVKNLEQACRTLWEDIGRDQVLFNYVDRLREEAENAFGLTGILEVSPELKTALLDFDLRAKREQFDRETYDCGVCLEPKKGAVCHRLNLCSHVFCLECLQDFYKSCITEGDVGSVKCLAPKCEESLHSPPAADEKKIEHIPSESKDRTLEPSELLQIRLSQETVQRYVTLKRKKALESDRNTVYCPRSWCQGPARHKLPADSNYIAKRDSADPPPMPKPADRLAICADCAFAFCLVCKASWHGEYYACFPRSQFELTAEEKASEDYMLLHTQGCPTCDARAQKTHGCNHMICFKCNTHFCYLCGSYLEKGNPYQHFNNKAGPCYMRLWELEEGDDAEFGQAFGGGGGGGGGGAAARARQDEFEVIFDDSASDSVSDDTDSSDEDGNPPAHAARPALPPPAPEVPRARRGAGRGGGRAGGAAGREGRNAPGPALRAFLEMARRDAEDEWDSDEMSSGDDEDDDDDR